MSAPPLNLQSQFDQPHPLVSHRFLTDGINLFIEGCGHLLNVSQNGQLALQAALDLHLDRIEWSDRGLALRLYPFTRTLEEQSPKILAFEPRIAFGRLALPEIGVATEVVVDRSLPRRGNPARFGRGLQLRSGLD